MKTTDYDKVLAEANYIISTGATVRKASKIFNISKSTVWNHMRYTLPNINAALAEDVYKIFEAHIEQRAHNGGKALQAKRGKRNVR